MSNIGLHYTFPERQLGKMGKAVNRSFNKNLLEAVKIIQLDL